MNNDFTSNDEYNLYNSETKFFEGMINPKKFKTRYLGRYFNIVFFVRLGLFEMLMVSY
jgi:hypothetical protein